MTADDDGDRGAREGPEESPAAIADLDDDALEDLMDSVPAGPGEGRS